MPEFLAASCFDHGHGVALIDHPDVTHGILLHQSGWREAALEFCRRCKREEAERKGGSPGYLPYVPFGSSPVPAPKDAASVWAARDASAGAKALGTGDRADASGLLVQQSSGLSSGSGGGEPIKLRPLHSLWSVAAAER